MFSLQIKLTKSAVYRCDIVVFSGTTFLSFLVKENEGFPSKIIMSLDRNSRQMDPVKKVMSGGAA